MYTIVHTVDKDDDGKIKIEFEGTIDYDYVMLNGMSKIYDLLFDNIKTAVNEASTMNEDE